VDKPINMVDFAQRLCMGLGAVDKADHAATRPISPYDGLAWTTALAIVRARMEAARKRAQNVSLRDVDDATRCYSEGRYHALRDCLEEMEERGKS